jgi:hypothetical protein
VSVRNENAFRVLAAVMAVALSGAPRLAVALRPDAEHVCQCRAHGERHRCACPVCARLAREARRGAVEKLPPCHRAMALAELAEEEARDALATALPCLEPTCGGEEAQAGAPTGDSYLAPRPPSLAPPRGAERLVAPLVREADLPAAPDVPPPKRA